MVSGYISMLQIIKNIVDVMHVPATSLRRQSSAHIRFTQLPLSIAVHQL